MARCGPPPVRQPVFVPGEARPCSPAAQRHESLYQRTDPQCFSRPDAFPSGQPDSLAVHATLRTIVARTAPARSPARSRSTSCRSINIMPGPTGRSGIRTLALDQQQPRGALQPRFRLPRTRIRRADTKPPASDHPQDHRPRVVIHDVTNVPRPGKRTGSSNDSRSAFTGIKLR